MTTPQTGASTTVTGRKTLQDTIKEIETQIALQGPGPHSSKQQEDLAKLRDLHARALAEQEKLKNSKQQIQMTPIAITQPQVQPQIQQVTQPQVAVIAQQTQPPPTAVTSITTSAAGNSVQMVNMIKPVGSTNSMSIMDSTGAQQQQQLVTTPQPVTISRPMTVPGTSAPVSVPAGRVSPDSNQLLNKRRLQDLVKEVDPTEQLDDDVEELLLQITDDFVENVVTAACQLAKHRKANTVETKDVQLYLERNWNMWIPGFGSDEVRPYKKAATTEAHKQRLALVRKTLKK
ncbi:uncharacterized protein LOC144434182 [Glandiceps talaboti]